MQEPCVLNSGVAVRTLRTARSETVTRDVAAFSMVESGPRVLNQIAPVLFNYGRCVQSVDRQTSEHRITLTDRLGAHMSTAAHLETNKSLVKNFYDGGVRGDISAFRSHLHADFVCSAPDYLPWGGDTPSAAGYIDDVLPQVAKVLDFERFSYDSITAEGDHVVALINVGVKGTDAMIKISEHWNLRDGKATSIWVAYFEPAALLALIEHNKVSAT